MFIIKFPGHHLLPAPWSCSHHHAVSIFRSWRGAGNGGDSQRNRWRFRGDEIYVCIFSYIYIWYHLNGYIYIYVYVVNWIYFIWYHHSIYYMIYMTYIWWIQSELFAAWTVFFFIRFQLRKQSGLGFRLKQCTVQILQKPWLTDVVL